MLQCLINGTPYPALYDFSIVEQTGNKTSSDVSVRADGRPIPRAGDIIELRDGDNPLFWGICGIPRSPVYSTGNEWGIYRITCANANAILSRRIINEAFQGHTISDIVTALYDNYISAEGITLGTISDIDITIESYVAPDYNLQDALNELADLAGAVWTVTPDRVFSFIANADFPMFPVTINRAAGIGTDYQLVTKGYKTRTVQYISGATDTTSPQTEKFVYAGGSGANTFGLAFGVANKPAVSINDMPVDPSRVGVAGLDYNNDEIWFTFAYNSKTLTYNTQSSALTDGDIVTVVYTGIYPIRISMLDDARIAELHDMTGTSGMRETVSIATNTRSAADASALAASLLSRFSDATSEISFWLPSEQLYEIGLTLASTALLTRVTFDIPEWGMTGDYVIVERRLQPCYADMSDFESKLKVSLRLVNRDYMKSYGEILADLRRDVKSLAIRAEDVIIKNALTVDTQTISEIVSASAATAYFCVAATSGPLFAPCALDTSIYPV